MSQLLFVVPEKFVIIISVNLFALYRHRNYKAAACNVFFSQKINLIL